MLTKIGDMKIYFYIDHLLFYFDRLYFYLK